MLYTPILIVLLSTPARHVLPDLLLLSAATSAFCLQHVARIMLRRRRIQGNSAWFAVFLSLLLASGLPLLLVPRLRALLGIALLAAGIFGVNTALSLSRARRRFERTLWGETLGVLALTLTGPAASVVARGALGSPAWRLWAGAALYFTSGVFYVNLLLAAARSKTALDTRTRWRLGRGHLIYHALLAALVGCASVTMTPLPALLFVMAYAPILVRAFRGWIDLSNRRPNLKQVGMAELFYTLWFTGCWVAWLRWSE